MPVLPLVFCFSGCALPTVASKLLPRTEDSPHFQLFEPELQMYQGAPAERPARHDAEGRAAAFCLRDVRLRHRWAVRPRGHGHKERPRPDVALCLAPPAVLVDPGVAGGGRVDYRDSRGRWLLPLGARRIRRLLGIPCRLVELERIV